MLEIDNIKINKNPLLNPEKINQENSNFKSSYLNSIRPKKLTDYIGQKQVKQQLDIFISTAKARKECLDHVLLFGPPGLGKTTLAHIIANELEVNLELTSGPALEKAGDLAAILTNLQENDVLFIDEIHRLSPVIEEILYPAMEDQVLDIIVGEGAGARSIKLELKPFTLIGATTRAGLLTTPLRDRFGITQRLEFYQISDIAKIINRSSKIIDVQLDESGVIEIAKRSRGTPRIANRLLRRVRDYTEYHKYKIIDKDIADQALNLLNVNKNGLDQLDQKLLITLIHKFSGGPIGIESLAAILGEAKDTLEELVEPYLMQQGYLMRTPRGRVATELAIEHFSLHTEK